ncbi:MAG: AAA domain-containing protein [Oscillospiraceae bacterium]
MNKQNALKILNYWYTINFLEQESYPIEVVKKYAKDSKGSRKKEEKRKSLTVALEKNITDLDEDYLQKTIADEKEKNKLNVCGGISIYFGRFSREECLLETSRALGQTKYDDKRPEKNFDDIALMALRITEKGWYVGGSLCLSPVLWSIFKLHNNNKNTDLLALLSNDNYLKDISELEKKLFSKAEEGVPMKFVNAYEIIRNQYGRYIPEEFQQDKCIIEFQLFDNAETMEKYGETDILSLSKSFYATDINMVSEALKQNKLKSEMVHYCDILNTEDDNRRGRIDLVRNTPDALKAAVDEILDINNAPLGKWPSKYNPALMQQIAINLQTNPNAPTGNVFSVNGPPGTGKTTLLKEIIVNNIVERAVLLAEYENPDDAFDEHSFVNGNGKGGRYYQFVPYWCTFKNDKINDYGILVASCNNAAVENISKELPRQDKILKDITPDKETDELTAKAMNEVRALFDVNSAQHTLRVKKSKTDAAVDENDIFFSHWASNLLSGDDNSVSAWGLIAAPLGKKKNISDFYFGAMNDILKTQISFPDKEVKEQRPMDYCTARTDFLNQLKFVKSLRENISKNASERRESRQTYLDAVNVLKIENLDVLQNEYLRLQSSLENLKIDCGNKLNSLDLEYKVLDKNTTLQNEITQVQAQLDSFKMERLALNRDEIKLRSEALNGKKKGLFSLFKKQDNSAGEKLLLAEKIATQLSLIEEQISEKSRLLSSLTKSFEELQAQKSALAVKISEVKKTFVDSSSAIQGKMRDIQARLERIGRCENIVSQYKEQTPADFAEVDDELIRNILSGDSKVSTAAQLVNPWVTAEYNREREKLFYYAMNLHKCFLLASDCCKYNLITLAQYWKLRTGSDKNLVKFDSEEIKDIAPALFQTLFLMVPVISSTFASVGRLFKDVTKQNVIGTLIVDEAGQASPECVVGALYRCRKAMIVGDPKQVEPVVTDELDLLRNAFDDETLALYKNKSLSVQCFADRMNKLGTYLSGDNEPEWVGCPLLVHRRCISPMFEISNEISYAGIMKQQTEPPKADLEKKFVYERSMWIDVKGREIGSKNHYVREQGEKVCEIIRTALLKSGGISEIYIISPFTSVVLGVRNELKEVLRDSEEKLEHFLTNNIGTVHKFQGKEANEVIFLLGCDESAAGAVKWVNSNIVNVAATRAKFRLYIIGDRSENVWQKNKFLKIAMTLLD